MHPDPKQFYPRDDDYALARHLTQAHKALLLDAYRDDGNVIGAGFGRRTAGSQRTGDYAMVVYVIRKVPEQFLPTSVLLPRRVYSGRDYVEVDVVETGPIYPLSFTARERPAPSGISIGNANVSNAGTLGCLVTDNTDGSLCLLSNNHVIARSNSAIAGEMVVQQGIFDGGSTPADDIATLKRFTTIMAGATVDGAIAQVTNRADVVDQMKNNLMPIPSPTHPAVGLLFAGGCNRTYMNPINDVLNQLNIQFTAGAGSTAGADEGVNVEKVGRTTEYTTSTIAEIDVDVTINYTALGNVQLNNQIAAFWMSDKGDSGSVVCLGGDGGEVDNCGCLGTSSLEHLSGLDLGLDAALEKEFRDRYLSQTRLGRYLIDLYFRNERRLVERAQATRITESDRAFGRYLYSTYADDARMASLQVNNPDNRLTEKHMAEARRAMGRADQYLTPDESAAVEKLFALAQQAVGKNGSELLEMLNDEGLFREVVGILSEVRFLRQPDVEWGQPHSGKDSSLRSHLPRTQVPGE